MISPYNIPGNYVRQGGFLHRRAHIPIHLLTWERQTHVVALVIKYWFPPSLVNDYLKIHIFFCRILPCFPHHMHTHVWAYAQAHAHIHIHPHLWLDKTLVRRCPIFKSWVRFLLQARVWSDPSLCGNSGANLELQISI